MLLTNRQWTNHRDYKSGSGADLHGCVWHRIIEMILNPRRHPLNTENPTFDSFERCAIWNYT